MKGVWTDDTKRPRGSAHANAKLNEERVVLVRNLVRSGRSCRSVAARLGVNKSTIQRAVNFESWRHVGVSS
jgi:transposase